MINKTEDVGYLPHLKSREEFVDYLEGLVPRDGEYLESVKPTRQLVQTYMLETARDNHNTPELTDLFPERIRIHRLDDTLYRVEDEEHESRIVGLLEAFNSRHPVFFTTLRAEESSKWVREIVDSNPWLDRLWLSSPILFQLWNHVQSTTSPERYIRLGFNHETRYEMPSDLDRFEEYESESVSDHEDSGQSLIERRPSIVTITERLSFLSKRLDSLTENYDPLHSLVQLQIPDADRGGHLLYHNGQITNRSESFIGHRAIAKRIIRFYRHLTEYAENLLWMNAAEQDTGSYTFCGAPLTIKFSKPLSPTTFERFIDLGFRRKSSRLRIGGFISKHGPTKVHITAIDRHLWQPLLLEVTSKQILGLLPRGTCGNTVHRLVTNVQQDLDPNVEVWLGSETYDSAVASSMEASA